MSNRRLLLGLQKDIHEDPFVNIDLGGGWHTANYIVIIWRENLGGRGRFSWSFDTFGSPVDYGYGYHAFDKVEFCKNPSGHKLYRAPMTFVRSTAGITFDFNRFTNNTGGTAQFNLNGYLTVANTTSSRYTSDIVSFAYIDSISATHTDIYNDAICEVVSTAYAGGDSITKLCQVDESLIKGPFNIPNAWFSRAYFFNMPGVDIFRSSTSTLVGNEDAIGFGPFLAKVGRAWDGTIDKSHHDDDWVETLNKPCYKEYIGTKDGKQLISGFGVCDAYSKKVSIGGECNPEDKWDQVKCYLEGDTIIIDIHNPIYEQYGSSKYFYIANGNEHSSAHIIKY